MLFDGTTCGREEMLMLRRAPDERSECGGYWQIPWYSSSLSVYLLDVEVMLARSVQVKEDMS